MKRFILLLFSFVIIWSISVADTLSIDLDTASEDDVGAMIDELSQIRVNMIRERLAANPIQPTEEGAFTFRDIPWKSTKAQAEAIMGLSANREQPNIFIPIEVVEFPSSRYGVVKGETGVDARYSKLNVAGYQATMYCEFIYPIEDGVIIRDPELAQLYMGYYWISNEDYTDIEGVLGDLETKLSNVYGKPNDATTDYHTIKKWTDAYGNTIVLIASINMYDVAIAYIAADADESVEAMSNAVQNEIIKQEELERLKNSTNVDGL